MIDQYQQRGCSVVLQIALQGTEIEVAVLMQLRRSEQVRHNQDINWSVLMRDLARRPRGRWRARQSAQRAHYCPCYSKNPAVRRLAKQWRILSEAAGVFV